MKVSAEGRLPAAMDRTEAYSLYAIFRDFAREINYSEREGSASLRYVIDTASVADADPGAGILRFNNATQASATTLFIDNATEDATSVATFLADLPASGWILLVQASEKTRWHLYKWSAIVDGTGYRKFTVVSQAAGLALENGATALVALMPSPSAAGALLAANNLSDLASLATATSTLQSTGLVAGSVGFRNIPQNSQSAAYTTVAADSGKHIFHPAADANARTFTIDSNANVAYPLGTCITFVNETSQVVSIAITTDTLTLAGSTTSGTRSLAQNGVATALKVTTTKWVISGTGLT